MTVHGRPGRRHAAITRPAQRRAVLIRRWRAIRSAEEGIATAEYALVMVAAAALAGVLLLVIRSPMVQQAIEGIISSVFTA
ncbi:DUF4244 domain-containing protein [Bogoriella caseilytica]|uniref:Uncharacterized protein DUF4244 n=1 Tax=Bogoriella caseilytica TaxID=56055 RepID=A0A3N2BDU4_9MICO|nr:DUF4244 domain-containing protein [Bogoriella caseilytica]ROR73204.1 uncharacterized protein DUF4244 [Bogoriella caseilytica]